MFVKTTNGQVSQYPYTVGDLRKDNPNVSFPKIIPDEALASFGVFQIVEAPAPVYDERTQRLVTQQPALIDGRWTVTRAVVNKDQAQIENETNQKAANVRNQRDKLLSETDWTQLIDSPFSNDTNGVWQAYRQALRDVPQQEGFPFNVVWPKAPTS
jgi:hypothetical protein